MKIFLVEIQQIIPKNRIWKRAKKLQSLKRLLCFFLHIPVTDWYFSNIFRPHSIFFYPLIGGLQFARIRWIKISIRTRVGMKKMHAFFIVV